MAVTSLAGKSTGFKLPSLGLEPPQSIIDASPNWFSIDVDAELGLAHELVPELAA